MKTVWVTGATGFIGRHALLPLVERGYNVCALTRWKNPNLPEIKHINNKIKWIVSDLFTNDYLVEMNSNPPSHLLHFAWNVEHRKFWNSPENLKWVAASLTLLRNFVEHGGQRVVMAGTCAEYDWAGTKKIAEASTPINPVTLYGTSKNALNQLASVFCPMQNVSFAWGRIFLPFGPNEHPERLVASIINSLLAGQPALCTHGNQLRDFMHVSDIADAFVTLLDSEVRGDVNIASGQAVTIKQVGTIIGDLIKSTDLLEFGAISPPLNDPPSLVADVLRLNREVGWQPQFSIQERIKQTIDWWKINS